MSSTAEPALEPSTPAGRVDIVLLAEPRGFCAGVEMAIKALAWMVRSFPGPVYCYHEIVHNKLVVDRFRAQGVVFIAVFVVSSWWLARLLPAMWIG